MTRSLDSTFLHGVTRDSLLTIGTRCSAHRVSERRVRCCARCSNGRKSGEAALSGTAAVLAGVGTLIYQGAQNIGSAGGDVGPLTRALRAQSGGYTTG